MVRQWQESFYGNRFSNSYMKNGMPNFSEIAKAYNLFGYNVNTMEQFISLNFSLKQLDKAILIDVNVIENENCYPMVTPGRSNSQMMGLEN
jgi:acetolactate synthase-1/2/3 large subunit